MTYQNQSMERRTLENGFMISNKHTSESFFENVVGL